MEICCYGNTDLENIMTPINVDVLHPGFRIVINISTVNIC